MERNSAAASDSVLVQKPVKSPHSLITILAAFFIAIFLISLFFFYSAFNPFSRGQSFNSEKLVFSESGAKVRFNELLKAGYESKNKEEKFKNLIDAYLILWVDYFREPDPVKREVLSGLYSHLEKNFPNESKEVKLSVPCRQESCGAIFTYTPKLLELKNQVQKLVIQDVSRKSILSNIESAALVQSMGDNKQPLYSSYSAIFYGLRSAWSQDKNDEVKKITLSVLEIMKEIDLQRYEIEEKAGFYKVD